MKKVIAINYLLFITAQISPIDNNEVSIAKKLILINKALEWYRRTQTTQQAHAQQVSINQSHRLLKTVDEVATRFCNFALLTAIENNFCNPTFLNQSNFGTTGVTLSSAGVYKLSANIIYSPSSSTPAITIAASDITLDLQCFMLMQGNFTANVDAIKVNSNLSDVIIKNGMIEDFTGSAINVQSGVTRLVIDDVTTFSCDTRGIQLIGTAAAPITQSKISNCNIFGSCRGSSADQVLTCSQCLDIDIQNCRFNGNGSSTNPLQVIRLDNCTKVQAKNIEANDNLGTTNFAGFDMSNSILCTLENCSVKNNKATASNSTARGFIFEGANGSTNNELLNCEALNITGTLTVDGFLTSTSCNDNLLINCRANFNSALGTSPSSNVHGFHSINNTRCMFIDCIANTNSAPNSTAVLPNFGAFGFGLNTTTANAIIRGIAIGESTGASSNAVGFRVINETACIVRDSQSSNNAFGFRLDPANETNTVFVRNIASKNTTQYSQFPGGSTQAAANITNINGALNNPWSNIAVG